MKQEDPKFACYVLVCENQREVGVCCGPRGGVDIRAALKQAVKDRGLQRYIRVSRAGCLDVCAQGPNVLVTSARGDQWYSEVSMDDVPALVDQLTAPYRTPSGDAEPCAPHATPKEKGIVPEAS